MHTTASRTAALVVAALLAGLVALAACSDGDDGAGGGDPGPVTSAPSGDASDPVTTTAPAAPVAWFVFSGQGNDLVAYASDPPFTRQVVIPNATDDPEHGRDINGQICFDPADPRRFVAGEDTDQSGAGDPGWGIFILDGDEIGDFSAEQVAKLVPTYQPSDDNPENYGCGFLPDGRILTTDIGNQASGPGDGQLIVWFPPFGFEGNRYCKVDIGLTTGQALLVTDEHVYLAEARAPGVFRYRIDDLPTSDDRSGRCGRTDATGAPLARRVPRERFVTPDDENRVATPNGLARSPDGNIFVSSVINGVIGEFRPDGTFVRRVLEPPPGDRLGATPFTTGTPLGIAFDGEGNLYFADIGLVIDEGIGPGSRTGTVRQIRFVDGEPQAPVVIDSGLAFPDGVGIYPPP
jgi:sugar lactone lactonase YvrE